MVRAALGRVARHYDGWLPNGTSADEWGLQWNEIRRLANAEGRDPDALTGAIYLTVSLDENRARAVERARDYLERYYLRPADELIDEQRYYAGPAHEFGELLMRYRDAGARHFVLRFLGDHDRLLKTVARLRAELGW
jgi:alkanesulfonate monooxygenase SsuD/methylene tetrahydromethanopterin reductase-like flavin-dependent oxidoreductase (luciferase family)